MQYLQLNSTQRNATSLRVPAKRGERSHRVPRPCEAPRALAGSGESLAEPWPGGRRRHSSACPASTLVCSISPPPGNSAVAEHALRSAASRCSHPPSPPPLHEQAPIITFPLRRNLMRARPMMPPPTLFSLS